MKLVIDGATGLVTVDEAENLKSLAVDLQGCSPERAAVLLGDRGLGRIEGGHAWLHIGALRAMARPPRSCTWDERFHRAMAYAQQNGWSDPAGDFVRAHLEPTSLPADGTAADERAAVGADTPLASPPTNSRPAANQES